MIMHRRRRDEGRRKEIQYNYAEGEGQARKMSTEGGRRRDEMIEHGRMRKKKEKGAIIIHGRRRNEGGEEEKRREMCSDYAQEE